MPKQKISPLIFDTYLAIIKNSLGSKMFRNFYVKINGKHIDIMKNGQYSCAFYLSNILKTFNLIKKPHVTVISTIKDMQKSRWQKIKKPKIGSVLVWEIKKFGKNDIHTHIGFYIGNHQAISNSSNKGCPIKHHWTFNNERKITAIYWHPKLSL